MSQKGNKSRKSIEDIKINIYVDEKDEIIVNNDIVFKNPEKYQKSIIPYVFNVTDKDRKVRGHDIIVGAFNSADFKTKREVKEFRYLIQNKQVSLNIEFYYYHNVKNARLITTGSNSYILYVFCMFHKHTHTTLQLKHSEVMV